MCHRRLSSVKHKASPDDAACEPAKIVRNVLSAHFQYESHGCRCTVAYLPEHLLHRIGSLPLSGAKLTTLRARPNDSGGSFLGIKHRLCLESAGQSLGQSQNWSSSCGRIAVATKGM